jgi:TolB-like protein/Tfp pilus assembly protein PilF
MLNTKPSQPPKLLFGYGTGGDNREHDEMNADRWQKLKNIFDVAAEMEPALQEAYLAENCGSDEEMYSELKSLLKSYKEAPKFLQPSHPPDAGLTISDKPPTLSQGQIIGGRFRILSFVGGGGMGEVYEAFDQRLGDRIAMKIIRSAASSETDMARFHKEVQLARRVTHPNICRVFDLEQCACAELGSEIIFLTMEFLEGETLRERLRRACPVPVDEGLEVIRQIALGLAASHAADVIHRDLKPSNVILATSGAPEIMRAVVTDFGVARLADNIRRSGPSAITGKNEIIGTLDYMAPEQIERGRITPATDIYALGLIMYEMLTGRKAFPGDTTTSLAHRIKGTLISPRTHMKELDIGLELLILNCLAVDPEQRTDDATLIVRMVDEFRGATAGESRVRARRPASAQASIAVLPFTNIGPDVEGEYFGDGLAEELIGALNRVDGLRVVARTSAFRYRDRKMDIREVARELNVNLAVEGTVRRSGNRLRVTVRLVNAANGYHLWSDRYDRGMEDVFAVQEEIANTIAAQLQMKLRAEQGPQFVQHRTQIIEAYNLFLKGRYFANKRTPRNLQKAREHFKMALQHDPQFAPALAAFADCCVIQGVYGMRPPQEVFPLAKETVFKALALGPQMAEAHCSAGCIQAIYDWDWISAERSFQRALELDPNYATAHHCYALYCLIPQGRFVKARAQIAFALGNDPLSLAINASVAVQSYFERRYDDAIRECTEILEMDPNFGMAYFFLGQAYEQKGLYPEAVAALEQAVTLTERSAEALAWLGRTWAMAGESGKAHAVLEELNCLALTQYISPVLFAELLLGLHETEAALDHLERAWASRATDLIWIEVRPAFDVLRSEPRFHEICKRIGLH